MLTTSIRIMAAGVLLFIAFILGRDRRNLRGFIGASFLVCVAMYVWCSIVHKAGADNPFLLPLYAGCISVAFFFYLFSCALFDESFKPRWWHFLILLTQLVLGYRRLLAGEQVEGEGVFSDLLRFVIQFGPALISLSLIAMAVVRVYAGRANDLVESRRKFRRVFVLGTGLYALLVTVVELWLQEKPASDSIDFVHSIAIAGLTAYLGQKVATLRSSAFEPERAEVPAEAQDKDLIDRLRGAMEKELVFKEEALTIGRLANRLNVQEYKLRRTINGALGFRNFTDFLNYYRIAQAARTLRSDAEIPILRVAMDMGYGSLAPFNRAFKALQGVTPTEFRKSQPDKGQS